MSFRAVLFGFLTLTMICRKINATDPKWEVTTYSQSTSTSPLRSHLRVKHLDVFQRAILEHGWEVSQAQSQARCEATASQLAQQDEFTERSFHKHILDFVIADDQVRPHLSSFYVHYAHVESQVCERHRTFRIQETPPPSTDRYHGRHDPASY